jgi:hypothetical protein
LKKGRFGILEGSRLWGIKIRGIMETWRDGEREQKRREVIEERKGEWGSEGILKRVVAQKWCYYIDI